jgi:hypothetical protein
MAEKDLSMIFGKIAEARIVVKMPAGSLAQVWQCFQNDG